MSTTINNAPAEIMIVEGTAIASYGERAEVRELTSRMMKFHPEAHAVGEAGMLEVAQLAILTGANPLPTTGEIYVYKDGRGVHVILGIAYWRRKAREVDTPIWYEDWGDTNQDRRDYQPRKMLPEERALNGVLEGDIAGICKCYRLSEYLKLTGSGMPWKVAQSAISRTGIGIVNVSELTAKNGSAKAPPKGRSWQWVANKRAEQDVYRLLSLTSESIGATQSDKETAELNQLFTQSAPVEDANDIFFEQA